MQIETIGIIGLGDMGKLYAKSAARVGYKVTGYDLPQKREQLEQDLIGTDVNILNSAAEVAKRSDLTFLLVPVENIAESVPEWAASVKKGAIVSSGASVMTPAIMALEKHLDRNAKIINWHWLAGPAVPVPNMDSALVSYRSDNESYRAMYDAIKPIGPKILELPSYELHDKITADTQAVTHIGFESLGTAWKEMNQYPWENSTYVGGIDNVKVLMCLRIYGGKPHVYSGLAIYNPFADRQIEQYDRSVSSLYKLMVQGKEGEFEFRKRIDEASAAIFNNINSPILLDDKVMGEFSLGLSSRQRTPNSHLSLLAMVDAWHQAGINPYDHMICQTPVYRLRLGIAEYLFRNKDLLEESIQAALYEEKLRKDDAAFCSAVSIWSTAVGSCLASAYHYQFLDTQAFFIKRIPEGMQRSGELIKRLSQVE